MTHAEAQNVLNKIIEQIFGFANPLTLDQFMKKFAFDVRLPQAVVDFTDGSTTWASSTNPTKFVEMKKARSLTVGDAGPDTDFMRPKRSLKSIQDILDAWSELNYTTTERYVDCLNVSESDNICRSENVFRSQDVGDSRNILFSDGVYHSEYVVSGQRSTGSTYCARIEDSGNCSNSFNVSFCGHVTNCFFMHDTGDMQDSMFCTNVKGKRYCIANMQYEKEEYEAIREIVAKWILTA